jgi:hypothetical protein
MNELAHFGIRRSLVDVQQRAIELKKGKQASQVRERKKKTDNC